MNSFDSLLKRNKDFAAQQAAGGTLYAVAPAGATQCKGDHHWLRRYARGSGTRTWN